MNLQNKYKDKILIITNTENLGFVRTCNKGLKVAKADYVLLLNTDCIISRNTISKLMEHIENNLEIGLICPISSNAANLTLDIFEGFNYSQMNDLLEKKFKGQLFDACTVVGNCLMITRKCLNVVGDLDEIYGNGYGEETDYQFRAMENGFQAKVAIDTYVFHKAEVSFGTSIEKQKKIQKNRKIFFDRWGEKYEELHKKYAKYDPVEYIKNSITKEEKRIQTDIIFYLPGLGQGIGGVHIVVDIINYLSIRNISINVMCDIINDFQEAMLFNPVPVSKYKEISTHKIVSTLYTTTFLSKKISLSQNIPLISFIQGYETLFSNGQDYGIVDVSYKIPDYMLCVSDYLSNELNTNFNRQTAVITNGVNYDLLKNNRVSKNQKTIALSLRGSTMKGDWILLDIIKKLFLRTNNIILNIIYQDANIIFPENINNTIIINKYPGPLSREDVANILKNSDIFIDASLNEGFGLHGIEAMAAGCVVIAADSLGNQAYLKNGYNGLVANQVNNPDTYVDKIISLIEDETLYCQLLQGAKLTAKEFDFDDRVEQYIEFFNASNSITTSLNKYSDFENNIMHTMWNKVENSIANQLVHNEPLNQIIVDVPLARRIAKKLPKPVKNIIKKILFGTNI